MYTDLFMALLDKENPRGHPILAALTYAFCPAAARWWLAGVDPVIPFDPLWQALEDLVSGSTLKEALSSYGTTTVCAGIYTSPSKVVQTRRFAAWLATIRQPSLPIGFRPPGLPSLDWP